MSGVSVELVEIARSIDWLAVATTIPPYIIAVLALVEARTARLTSRSASAQAAHLSSQLEILAAQLEVEEKSAMSVMRPQFVLKPIGAGELGVLTQHSDGSPSFGTLDAPARRDPSTWVRCTPVMIECTSAPGPLLVNAQARPDEVQVLEWTGEPFTVGTRFRTSLVYPESMSQRDIVVALISHLPSDPHRTWTAELRLI